MRSTVVSSALGAALGYKVDITPVQQVIVQLEDMQTKVVNEGMAEARTYNEYACFCKDNTAERSENIQDRSNAIKDYNADLADYDSKRTKTNTEIARLEKSIDDDTKSKAKKTKEYNAAKAQHEVETADMSKALDQIATAVNQLRAGRATNFVQIRSLVRIAVAKGLAPAVPSEDYATHEGTQKIIKLLQQLEQDFLGQRQSDEKAFIEGTTRTFQAEAQELTDLIKEANVALKKQEARLSNLNEKIALAQTELTVTQKLFTDDQEFLKELTKQCVAKKALFDQRSAMRQDEISAITGAVAIIHTTVSDMADVTTHKGDAKKEELIEEPVPASFVQVRAHSHAMLRGLRDMPTATERAAELLATASRKLGRRELATLAMHVSAGDPFAKVKDLIQTLIERLQKEANTESDHHAWCETQTTAAEQARDTAADQIATLNADLLANEAARNSAMDQIKQLAAELEENEKEQKSANEDRKESNEENTQTIRDSKAGLVAVTAATKILETFYKGAAEAAAAEFVQKPEIGAPDAGFDEKYGGDQSTSSGIFGMLEVITSDFERSIKQTGELEQQQVDEHRELTTKLKASHAAKTETKNRTTETHSELTSEINDELNSLSNEQNTHNGAIDELSSLKQACVDSGVSPEVRAAKREEEIQALRQALKILAADE